MRIALLIGKLMMNAVRRHPENRPAFQRQRCADGQKIFHPLRSLESAVREQAVIRHADAQAARHPPQEDRDEQRLPRKEEKSRNGPDVKRAIKIAVIQFTSPFSRLRFLEILQFHFQAVSPCAFDVEVTFLNLSGEPRRGL